MPSLYFSTVSGWVWDLTGHRKKFITPSFNSIIVHSNNPRSSLSVSESNFIDGMHQVQGINVRTISGVSLGGFVSALRYPHGYCPPNYVVAELRRVRVLNVRMLAGVALDRFVSIIRYPHSDSSTRSILPLVSLK